MIAEKQHNETNIELVALDVVYIHMADLEKFVTIAFKDDTDFIELYHFQDKTMDELITNNVKNIIEFAKDKEVKCYGIFLEQTPIGFTVLTDTMLYSFGINVYCREKEIVLKWFNWIKKIFENKFWVVLYRENTRAIKFFTRNGLDEFYDDGTAIYLLYSLT